MKISILHSLKLMSVIVLFLNACIPARQYEDAKGKAAKLEQENSKLKAESLDYTTRNKELSTQLSDIKGKQATLESDTTNLGRGMRRLTALYDELSKSYDKLIANQDKLMAEGNADAKKTIGQLQSTQEELQKKEDQVKKLFADLNERERKMNEMDLQIKERENRVKELEGLISKKDSAVKALQTSISDALLNYKDKGLSVFQKNGLVYISMEERLLFASGSTVVDKEGQNALKDLAKALEKSPDLRVLIQGHTDNVPIAAGVIKDNWDLSVLRATSVVRIMLAGSKINPAQLTPAGKGEFAPVAANDTPDNKRKNRRIDIILMPNVDEIIKLVGN